MPKLVDCGVCGKKFAVTDEEFDRSQVMANVFKKEKAKVKFICKYCKKMIKEEN